MEYNKKREKKNNINKNCFQKYKSFLRNQKNCMLEPRAAEEEEDGKFKYIFWLLLSVAAYHVSFFIKVFTCMLRGKCSSLFHYLSVCLCVGGFS